MVMGRLLHFALAAVVRLVRRPALRQRLQCVQQLHQQQGWWQQGRLEQQQRWEWRQGQL